MKKILITLLVLAFTGLRAQNFEGVVKWTMKMDITDPELKAKMSEGQAEMKQKMNDPANQAKMKELQEKMKDPQFKAMMENNPQMKAMMDKLQQGAASGDMMGSMMPKGMTIKIKDGNSLVSMEGGMMKGDILNLKDKSVHLDRENKTYWVMQAPGDREGKPAAKPTITKTTETAKIAGYNCVKYIVTMQDYGQTMTSNIWTTTEIAGIDTKALARRNMGKGPSMFYEGMDGIAMKVESQTPQGNMVMEVTEVKKQSLSAADFTIPSDYTEKKGMF